jgi:hypothetical protein
MKEKKQWCERKCDECEFKRGNNNNIDNIEIKTESLMKEKKQWCERKCDECEFKRGNNNNNIDNIEIKT